MSSTVARLKSPTLIESAGISSVSMWTEIKSSSSSPSLGVGWGDTLDSASATTLSFPFRYSMFTSYWDSLSNSLWRRWVAHYGFLPYADQWLVICLNCRCVSIHIMMKSFKSKNNTKQLLFNVRVRLFRLSEGSRCIDHRLINLDKNCS